MPAIQLRERRRVPAGLGNQLPSIHFRAVVACANIHFSTDFGRCTIYHRYYKCATNKNVAKKNRKWYHFSAQCRDLGDKSYG
jgi:hypothetical protein